MGKDQRPRTTSLLFSADGQGLPFLKRLQDGAEFEALRRPWLAAIVIIIYVVVLTFGVLGNGLVFVTVASAPRMRTATNIFIANLALADCFVCAFDLPLNLHYQVEIAVIFMTERITKLFTNLFLTPKQYRITRIKIQIKVPKQNKK